MTLLFVYGSLRKGGTRNTVMKNEVFVGNAELKDYALYEDDSNNYPVAVKKEGGLIKGEVYKIGRLCEHFLDELEGEGMMFKKAHVHVKIGENPEVDTRVRAYIWMLSHEYMLEIESGDWINHKKQYNDTNL